MSAATPGAAAAPFDAGLADRLLLCDVDGVLTDGTILLDADGRESKRF